MLCLRATTLLPSLALFAFGLLPRVVDAADWRGIPYDDATKVGRAVQRLDTAGVMQLRFRILPGEGFDKLPDGLAFRVTDRKQIVPLTLDGPVLSLPLRQDWADDEASIEVNQPKGRVRMAMDMLARLPESAEIRYGRLTESADLMTRLIADQAGMMRFMAPKVRGIELHYGADAHVQAIVHLQNGSERRFESDSDGLLLLPWEPDWKAATVTLSALPERLFPRLK